MASIGCSFTENPYLNATGFTRAQLEEKGVEITDTTFGPQHGIAYNGTPCVSFTFNGKDYTIYDMPDYIHIEID